MAGVITAINGQRRHPERANLHLDGEFCCGIAWELVLKEGLRTGEAVSGELLARLRAADEAWRALQAALSLLGARQRTRAELADRLRRRDFGADAVSHALAECERLQLLDDVAFAESWVRDRLRLRPRGARALVAELTRKGVTGDAARATVDRVMATQGTDDGELCQAAAEKWARSNQRLTTATTPEDRQRAERRLLGFLTRRGFAPGNARSAARQVLGEARP